MRAVKTLLASMALAGLATASAAQDATRVVTVNYALQYFAERLLGDAGEVVFPVPADVDPSFWRPTIADISAVQSADLILLNGAGFATWVDRVSLPRSRLVNTSSTIEDQFIVTESITHSHGDGGEHSHEGLASYTWLDPTLAIAQAEAIAAAITARDLATGDAVEDRLAALRTDLEGLDAEAKAALAPAQGITIIATHPRYQYLARRYDLSVTALEWEAGAMPSEADLADLSALIAETDANVLVWEAAPPAAALEATAALGLQNVIFEPLAQTPDTGTFTAVFQAAVASLAAAAGQGASN
ncbi:MAG: metal ABC transporter substrate-binding protein [Pseudomonadota bacterium]